MTESTDRIVRLRALGRDFDADPHGRLLDVAGDPTEFPVMGLEIVMASLPPHHPFQDEVREGDSIAYHGAMVVKTRGEPDGKDYTYALLIRDGRMVKSLSGDFAPQFFA
jgi:hypothetical protein